VFLDQSDEIGLWESNFPLYLFPQIHHFPEFSLKCQAHYIPDQRAIITSTGDALFFITPKDIDQMMQIPHVDFASPFNLEILTELYQKMTFSPKSSNIRVVPSHLGSIPSSMFSTKGNQVISSLCDLLGYYSDPWVDETILGFLSIFSTDEKPTTQFDFSTFLANNIHEQFMNFGIECMSRYSSILAYMFVFYQADKFNFSMQKMDADGRPQPVTAWTSLLKRKSTEYRFKAFIDIFYHRVVIILSGRPEPRINDEFQRILHLSDNAKTGDWYLYQNHTEIRVFGCELAPYKLPKYVSVRIFALEYIRHIMNSYDIHFCFPEEKAATENQGADWLLHLQQSRHQGRS
jgi:hypothetical protein